MSLDNSHKHTPARMDESIRSGGPCPSLEGNSPDSYRDYYDYLLVQQKNLREFAKPVCRQAGQREKEVLLNHPQLFPHFFESNQCFIQMLFFVSCRKLNSDTSFIFWNNRIEKSNNVNSFVQ